MEIAIVILALIAAILIPPRLAQSKAEEEIEETLGEYVERMR